MRNITDLSFLIIYLFSVSFLSLVIDADNKATKMKEESFQLVVDSYCYSLTDKIEYKFSEEFNNFYIVFNKFPEDDGIKQIFLNFDFADKNTNYTLGLDYHFIKPVYLSTKNRVHTISNPFTMPLNTYSGSSEITFSLSLYVKFINNDVCGANLFRDYETEIHDDSSRYFVNINESVVPEWYFKDLSVENKFFDYVQLSNQLSIDNFNSYAKVSDKALFLSIYDWDQENLEWTRYNHHKLLSPVNLVFFGDFTDSELTAVALFIDMMKDVAPDLEINFATDQDEGTLYIHKSLCVDSSPTLSCDEFIGYYRSTFNDNKIKPNHGVIWVDEDSNLGEHILIHELAHAFGLNHNNCSDSIVSTSYQEDQFITLQPIDLAVLYAIYNNDFDYRKVNGLDESVVLKLNSFNQDYSEILDFPILWDACNFDYKKFEATDLKLDFLANELEKLFSLD